jgi:hypothetical protein
LLSRGYIGFGGKDKLERDKIGVGTKLVKGSKHVGARVDVEIVDRDQVGASVAVAGVADPRDGGTRSDGGNVAAKAVRTLGNSQTEGRVITGNADGFSFEGGERAVDNVKVDKRDFVRFGRDVSVLCAF